MPSPLKKKNQGQDAIFEREIASMFNDIAPSYDQLNAVLSLGLDRYWRKRLARLIPQQNNLFLLDLATGTADQLLQLVKRCPQIEKALGIDIATAMIEKGRVKVKALGLDNKVELKEGSALKIPLNSNSAHCITMSFGIRNVADVSACLCEALRTLKPGGRLLILEFSKPTHPLIRWGHRQYLKRVVPNVGKLLSGKKYAYDYLEQSIGVFEDPKAIASLFKKTGFLNFQHIRMTFGTVSIYVGEKG